MLTERHERLNALAKINSASKYLEVGVYGGDTFTRVNVPYKVGVDPKFGFDVREYADERTVFHEVTSDCFFSRLAPAHDPFDLIYLDGLHTFDQTFRDFCASLRYSHARTIWLLDDTHPSGPLAANPDLRVTRWLHRLFRVKNGDWMGDVFKVVFAIHDFFPQFTYATFPGHGQTAVWLETRQNFRPTWNSLKKICGLGYRDFLKFRDSHMSIMGPAELLGSVKPGGV
jgi:hypothetical protein